MPELPEVETVRRGLADAVAGQVLQQVQLLHPRVARYHRGSPQDLQAQVRGGRLGPVGRHGKFLWFTVEAGTGNPLALVAHLGMSGQFRLVPVASPVGAHTRAVVEIDRQGQHLRFLDQRTFGFVFVEPLVAVAQGGYPPVLPARLTSLGPDPSAAGFDARMVAQRLRGTARAVKTALLDQQVLAGVGNIYADEALWHIGIAPSVAASSLSVARLSELVEAAGQVMQESLARGGTSFDSLYVAVNGESGANSAHLQVYGRAGQPCRRCDITLVREVIGGRGSIFCPHCQPRRRTRGR